MSQTFDELISAAKAAHHAEVEALQTRIDELEAGEPPAPVEVTWTVTTPRGVSVRKGPGTHYGYAAPALLVGTRIRELERQPSGDDLWIRHSAGWSAARYDGQVLMTAETSTTPPSDGVSFDPPVGSDAERRGPQVWPGTWFDATGYAAYYTAVGPAYHTGADLNNNSPAWDSDRLAAVYAAADGVVTHAGTLSGTWGKVIVIEHGPKLHSRYAHLADMSVEAGQTVQRGDPIGHIGNADGKLGNYHLHFDISTSGILATQPGHWPGNNRAAVLEHYVDPKEYILTHRPGSDYEAIAPVGEGWIGFDGPGDTGSPTNPLEMEGWPYLVPEHQVLSKIAMSKVQAMRLHFPGTPAAVIEQIKALPSIKFLCGRVRYDFPAGRDTPPEMHLEAVAPFIQRGIDHGVEWWSIINEPNIPDSIAPEGNGGAWTSATGCGTWLVEWAWRARQRWPGIKLLLPAVSPGIEGHEGWWQKMADYALDEMDGVEIHAYWTDAATLAVEIERVVSFASEMRYKPVFVTECANVVGASPQDKAVQFVKFWQEVTSRTSNIEFVGWFNVFTTHPDHKVSEVDLAMAEALGQLIEEM